MTKVNKMPLDIDPDNPLILITNIKVDIAAEVQGGRGPFSRSHCKEINTNQMSIKFRYLLDPNIKHSNPYLCSVEIQNLLKF